MDKLNKALIALVILGLLVSVYMTIYKYTENDAMCVGSSDCKTINASSFSEIYGIPVALVGVGGYAAILATVLFE
ncbi:MAG: vitamin K epoxide reductase family protein, partial [Chloroflexota bacterium]